MKALPIMTTDTRSTSSTSTSGNSNATSSSSSEEDAVSYSEPLLSLKSAWQRIRRKTVPKPKKEPKPFDTENWMTNLPKELTEVPLCQLAIPGTHNSFTNTLKHAAEVINDQIKVECHHRLPPIRR